MKQFFLISLSLLVVGLSGCAHSPPDDPWDPIEPVNRKVFAFNQLADTYVIRPVAVGYDSVTPDPVQKRVGYFFANAREPITTVNSALQLKWHRFNVSLGRFLINTTVGVLGIFDVASAIGIDKPREDFGQTLGYWGVGEGAYLVLPFIGPSNGRDVLGLVGDVYTAPMNYMDSWELIFATKTLYFLNLRASFLSFDNVLEQQFDPYVFMRSYYLKQREARVHDRENEDDDAGQLSDDSFL